MLCNFRFSKSKCKQTFGGLYQHNSCMSCQFTELCLGAGSVLHVFSGKASKARPVVDVQTTQKKSETRRYQYFVYCKTCNALCPGKLRVKCDKCLQGAIVLEKEPDKWEDVIQTGYIHGFCTDCDLKQNAKFYFKCCSHDSDEEASPLMHVKPNRRHVECTICTEDRCPVLVYPCPDKHVVCVECFKTYAQMCLDQRTFTEDKDVGYSLPCPVGCDNSLIRDIHHFQLLGKQQYERYKDFGAEECVIQSGGVFCPSAGCGEAMFADDDSETAVQCYTCQHEFCRNCRLAMHTGECRPPEIPTLGTGTMSINEERAFRSRWDAESLNTIRQTTKPCPNCKVKTEKSGGCMHMWCSRCHSEWCWACEAKWNRTCQGDHWFG